MPRPPSRKSDPWSRGAVKRVVAGREEDESLVSLTQSMAEELVLSTDHLEWDDHPGLLPLAYGATLEEMARALQERAEKAVGIARGSAPPGKRSHPPPATAAGSAPAGTTPRSNVRGLRRFRDAGAGSRKRLPPAPPARQRPMNQRAQLVGRDVLSETVGHG